jgi:hypothetical protein
LAKGRSNIDGGHEQLISNGKRFNLAFAVRDMQKIMIDLREISTIWFKNQQCPSTRLSSLWGSEVFVSAVNDQEGGGGVGRRHPVGYWDTL